MNDQATATKSNQISNELEKLSFSNNFLCLLILLNYFFSFTRPQDTVSLIGTIKLPLIINALPIIVWLIGFQKNWTKQNLIMILFIALEAIRTLVGKLVIEEFVTNDNLQYQTVKSLALHIIGMALPIAVYFANFSALKLLFKCNILIGVYLAIYAVTHLGTGPGGFLGDENDMALALIFFLSFPLIVLVETKLNLFQKLSLSVVSFLLVLGIISTSSRGGFIGLVCVLVYIFLRSQKKLIFMLLGILILLSTIPFVTKSYLDEIKSISETSSGTAAIRKHYWKLATRLFLDPKNTVLGVGLNNTSFNIQNYESAEDLVSFPSSAGRVMHSVYFEVLGDLGLWGITIIGYLIFTSYRRNSRNYRLASELKDRLLIVYKRLSSENKNFEDSQEQINLNSSYRQLNFLGPLSLSVNVSIIAIFSTGAFISIAYYPYIWVVVGISSCLAIYSNRLLFYTEQLLEINKG